ncbi:MAG: D-aminoacylase [Bacteroidota bacterium]
MRPQALFLLLAFAVSASIAQVVVLRNGIVYDGSGGPPLNVDVVIAEGRLRELAPAGMGVGDTILDVAGLAVAPGFINMLSWATESLIKDGKSQSDIRQGVTLEVFGEGESMGPLSERMIRDMTELQGDIRFDVTWRTLGEYLEMLERKGISTNVASFVGATTIREHVLGYEDRPPTAEELQRMKTLVAEAMEEGALGVGSSLIYAPAFYASTEELIELCKVAASHGGMYISHLRSEGDRFEEAVEEFLRIVREAGIRGEIYHLKAAGTENWLKLDRVIRRIEDARREGAEVTADMYTYIAGATGLDAAMPPWVQEGGLREWIKRLQDPGIRARVKQEITAPKTEWESLYRAAGSADRVMLVAFKQDSLKYLTGKTLAEVARMRGTTPEEAAMDLVVQDDSRVGTVYFMMSEDNVRRQVALPWMSFGSDAESLAPEGVFLRSNPHPRAYGNFARLLGKYVREEPLMPLEEAIRKLTSLPAENLRVKDRGRLRPGFWADVVVFDPAAIRDHATFDQPHQYATGMRHVFVNGVQVLRDGEHTGALPGQFIRGPGYRHN